MATIEYTVTDDFGNSVYFDYDGETVECEGCIASFDATSIWESGQCGDCYGGYEVDRGVYGPGPDRRFYDGGRLIDPDDPMSIGRI